MPILDGLRLERARASKQYRDGRFHNPGNVTAALKSGSAGVVREFFLGARARLPERPLPVVSPLSTWSSPVSSPGLRVTWLGHSTTLLEIDGVRVLTDPVFRHRASPLPFMGPKRMHPVPATADRLPPIDVVLYSHDHHDHMDPTVVRMFAKRGVSFVAGLGVGVHLERFGVDPRRITELDWWEEYTLPGGAISFTSTPAQHFSGRGFHDRNQTLWSSWVMTTANRRVFFSGDTGLNDALAEIGKRFAPFDLTMLEIGASNPAWSTSHLGPINALRAFEMLGKGTLLPIHWGTFDLALHKWNEPAETLVTAAESLGCRVLTPRIGEPVEPANVERGTPWWRDVA